jgi:hypothetical protein
LLLHRFTHKIRRIFTHTRFAFFSFRVRAKTNAFIGQ